MKAVLWPFCFLFLLVMKVCSGVPCNGESYQKLKRQCTQALHQRVKEVRGDLTRNCRDFADYAVCLRDSWRISYCDNATALARHNDTLLEGMQRKYFRNCYNDTNAQEKECRPDKAFEKLLTCGNRFYNSAVHVSNKRSSISLASLCPEVDKYGLCAYKSQQEANCSLGYQMVPHLKYIAENIARRYRLLCTALRKSAFQKATTVCDRQRFINDMFLCGYHFANIAEVVGGNPQEVCMYIEKYKECHNTSIQNYGCAPPDHLYKDAEKFFALLTQKYNSTCTSQGRARNFPQTSRLTLKDGAGYTCDGNRFIRYFFQCAAGFVNATSNSLRDTQYICRAVSIYRHCVNGARHATHCNTKMELNSHIAFMQNFILEQYEPMCAVKRVRLSYQRILGDKECDSDRAQKKYEFCAGDFMRMLQLMEIGTDNERICQIREKYRECLETSSRETSCDFKSHALGRLQTLTTLLMRDYGIVCETPGDSAESGNGRLRHQACRDRGFLKAIEKCDHVFEDDAVLLKENVFRLASIRSSFVMRAKAMICLHVHDYRKCLMDTAMIFHCYKATTEVMDFFKQKLNRLGISYCSRAPSPYKPFTLAFLLTAVAVVVSSNAHIGSS